MFGAMLRSALPPLGSIFVRGPSCGSRNGCAWSVMCFRTESPLSLMGGALREKSCLKTNKSAAKRFIVRGNGRIKRGKGGRSHNTGHKGRKRVNQLAASAPITEKAIEERMRRLIRA
ncbi:hypothetical protein ACHAW5_000176 [Stephanodiscus triporus]|uniref:50S ribosomal protein L35 n=1 Tax=Stephanodiscus triporus TaxID=2934178 RepID=A0ABD3Q2M9_9STRA